MLLIRRVLAGHGQRQQRAPVITIRESDDGRTARVLARNLDRILGRLGSVDNSSVFSEPQPVRAG